MLQSKMIDNKVKIEDVKGDIFMKMLQYIYTGEYHTLPEIEERELLSAAVKYKVYDLKKKIIESISVCLSVNNVFDIINLASRCNEDILFENCINFIRM